MDRAKNVPVVLAALVLCFTGCTLNHPGEAPARGKLYFPTALATSVPEQDEPAKYLFVANSNFDLAYNAGSVQAYDLEALHSEIADCHAASDGDSAGDTDGDADAVSKSCVVATSDVLVDEVLIGSFAVAMAVSSSGETIYVPTRGDSGLTFIEVQQERGGDDLFLCGQNSGRRCGQDYVRGDEPDDSQQGKIKMPAEPVGLITGPLTDFDPRATDDGDYVLVAHRVGSVSLFLEQKGRNRGPFLVDVEQGFAERITGIGFDPVTAFGYLTSADFSGAVQSKSLERVGVAYSSEDSFHHSFIFNAGRLWLTGISVDRNTRDVAFAPDILPGRAMVVTRTPSSLIEVAVSEDQINANRALATGVTEVGSGASHVVLGPIGEDPRLFAFVSCFNSRELFIVDTGLGEPVAVVQGFSGPFALTLDSWRKKVYVADFRSSVIRVVNLEPVVCTTEDAEPACEKYYSPGPAPVPCSCLDGQETRVEATLGEPRPPVELL